MPAHPSSDAPSERASLLSRVPRGPGALAALGAVVLSAALFGVALALPTVSFRRLGSGLEVYSIWGGIRSLWNDGNWIMAPIVFLFSIVWPAGKLALLFRVAIGRGDETQRRKTLTWLRILGRWSMLDVFIVGLFVGAIRLGLLASASSRVGIEVFFVAILASMLSVLLVERAVVRGEVREHAEVLPAAARSGLARAVSTGALVVLAAALLTSLVEIKKGFLFRHEMFLPQTSWSLAREGEWVMAAGLGLFVMGTSSVRSLLLLRLRWFGGGPRCVRWTLGVDEWAMLEVGALGLAIVFVKLDELTTATRLLGFWLLQAAALLAVGDVWLLRAALRGPRSPR